MPDGLFNSKKPLCVLQTEFHLQEKEFIDETHFHKTRFDTEKTSEMAYSGDRVPWKNHALKLHEGLCTRYLAGKFQMWIYTS